MSRVRILLADDHPLFLAGVRSELVNNPDYEIVFESGNGKEAYEKIIELAPDVAILDFQMPEMTGLEICEKITSEGSATKIILLTMHNDKKIFFRSLDSGVKGYVLKDDVVIDIDEAVKLVAKGEHYISKSLTGALIEKATLKNTNNGVREKLELLTPSELRVLRLVALLKRNDEIAEELFISKRTVENHKGSIAAKLELNSARELMKFAVENRAII